ncbi:hypothetical protein P6U18_14670 [Pseudomonas sp. L01]|nr:hypothetical protein [Pseudomonas sp. L01]
MSAPKLLATQPDGKNIYESTQDMEVSSDSTTSTESYDCEEEIQACRESEDYSRCSHCGNKLISYEEAERITRSEASTFVALHAPKLIELETIKFNAKMRKMNGPPALRKMKSSVAGKNPK